MQLMNAVYESLNAKLRAKCFGMLTPNKYLCKKMHFSVMNGLVRTGVNKTKVNLNVYNVCTIQCITNFYTMFQQ